MSGGAPCGCGQAACGCCEGISALTPMPTENRPGLDSLSVRIGTHGSFLATMKARLSTHAFGKGPAAARPLAGLGVRDADASIALLDAFATVADVLTFYQERIVNEGYLRTATAMRSVRGLAGLVGYEPRPGLAASTWLAYTLDSNQAEPVVIAAGSRVRTVPGPGELPQIFETSEDLEARAAWSRLGIRRTEPTRWVAQAPSHELYLAGTTTRLKPGDPLLVGLGDDTPNAYRIVAIAEDSDAGRTRVELELWDGAPEAGTGMRAEMLAAAVHKIIAVRDDPPPGSTAAEIVQILADLREMGGNILMTETRLRELLGDLAELRLYVVTKVESVPNPAGAVKLRAWATRLEQAFAALAGLIERHLGEGAPQCSVEALIGKLTLPRSAPLASPLQLPGSLRERFETAGDAGLTMLAQSSPELADRLAAGLAGCRAEDEKVPPIRVYALRLRSQLFGHNFPRQRRTRNLNGTIETEEVGEWPIVTADRNPAGQFFGFVKREARDRLDLDGNHDGILANSWVLADMTGVPDFPDSPATPGAGPGLPGAAVARAGPWRVARIRSAHASMARADYGGTGPITRLLIDTPRDDDGWLKIAPDAKLDGLIRQEIANRDYQVVRGTTIYAASEALALAPSPMVDPVCDGSSRGAPIELDGLYLGLQPGRFVLVAGERADIEHVEGVAGVEPAMIARVVHDVRGVARDLPPAFHGGVPGEAGRVAPWSQLKADGFSNMAPPEKLAGDTLHTFIWLEKPLSYCYRRDSIAIHANLVRASHGETHEETLGSGDGGKPNQGFTLGHSPLTYVPAPTAAGAADTLEVFVNDIRWDGAGSFVDLPATARAYVIRTDHEGKSSVVFGDGVEGARLPTGTLNVAATYRSGLGLAGNVRAGQISQLVTRPLGVKEVVNPLRASGGAEPETRDQARRNAPLATAALGRVVAPRDYADFARTFAGIAMADAHEISDGTRSVIHVTVAGLDDAPLDPGSQLLVALRKAYRQLGDPFQAVQVEPRERLLLVVEAGLRIDPDRRWEVVAAAVRKALLDTFGFERRILGEGVASSEILNAIQSVEGVAMVDLDVFGAIPAATTGSDGARRPLTPGETEEAIKVAVAAGVAAKVDARRVRLQDGLLVPAELLVLSPEVAATLVLNQIGGEG